MVDFITGRRILIADDQMLIALAIAEDLEAEGALIVGPASSLQTALAFLISERVDAAVLDIRLGDSPVYPVADALTERGVPFLFATGCEADDLPERYSHVPICHKPFGTDGVRNALQKFMPA